MVGGSNILDFAEVAALLLLPLNPTVSVRSRKKTHGQRSATIPLSGTKRCAESEVAMDLPIR